MSRKKLAIMLVALLLLPAILAACSGGAVDDQDAVDIPQGSVPLADGGGISGVVRVAYAGAMAEDGIDEVTGAPKRSFDTVFKESFTPQFPDVQVEITAVPWTDYSTKLQTLLMSDSVDVLGSGGSEITYYEQGLLMELDDLIANDPDFHPEDYFVGSSWNDCVFNMSEDGKRFGLPAVLGFRMIVYDTKLFDDWGVEYLSHHPTPDEVLEKAAQMTGTNPQTGEHNYGLWFDGNNLANSLYTTLGIYYDAPGFSGTRGEGIKSYTMEFNTPNAVKVFEFVEKAVAFCNPGIVTGGGSENFGLETNNTAIYLEHNPRVVMSGYRQTGDTTMIERFVPTLNFGPNGEGWVACDNVVIAKNAANLEASWEVAKFLTSYDFFEYCYTDLSWCVPIKPELADFIDPVDVYTATAMEIAQYGSVNAHDYLQELNSTELTSFFAGYVAQCVNNQNPTPQEAADDLQARAERWHSNLR